MPGAVSFTVMASVPAEQLQGQTPTERSDLWSLAVVVYEMLTGAYPFGAGDFRAQLLQGRFIPTRDYVPSAPQAWDRFFACALASDPVRHPLSAAAFLSAFEQDVLGSATASARK